MSLSRSAQPRLFPAALLAVAFTTVLAAAGPHSAEVSSEAPPPLVLVLHGRGVHAVDTAGLRHSWRAALNDGIELAGSSLRLSEDDVRLVWYAEALDPRSRGEPCAHRSPVSGDTRQGGEVTAIMGVVGSLLGLAADWVGELEAVALRSVAGDLLYLGEAGKRCAAEERLAGALDAAAGEGRPVILVAHSFGSLVAYTHLQSRASDAAVPVARLITVGSLIGYPELRELLLGPEAGTVSLPPGVGSWVNVRDPMDPLAAPLMDPGGLAGDESVSDRRTEGRAGPDPHDAARYLSDPATARAVLESWCTLLAAGDPTARECPAG